MCIFNLCYFNLSEGRSKSTEEPPAISPASSSVHSLSEPPELPEPPEDLPKPMHEAYERIVKSPPEPTRVRSPDQIMTKSPDPVTWTVPLDTGRMFTVTQNVPQGK